MPWHHEAALATFSAWRGTSGMVELPPFQRCLAAHSLGWACPDPSTGPGRPRAAIPPSQESTSALVTKQLMGTEADFLEVHNMFWGHRLLPRWPEVLKEVMNTQATTCKMLCRSPGPSLLFCSLRIYTLSKREVRTCQPLILSMAPSASWGQRCTMTTPWSLTACMPTEKTFFPPSLFSSKLVQPGAGQTKHPSATASSWAMLIMKNDPLNTFGNDTTIKNTSKQTLSRIHWADGVPGVHRSHCSPPLIFSLNSLIFLVFLCKLTLQTNL